MEAINERINFYKNEVKILSENKLDEFGRWMLSTAKLRLKVWEEIRDSIN